MKSSTGFGMMIAAWLSFLGPPMPLVVLVVGFWIWMVGEAE